MDFPRLRVELTTDPLTKGYAGMTDAQAATSLNDATSGRVRRRSDIAPREIFENLNTTDIVALPGAPTVAQLSQERRDLAYLTSLAALPELRLVNDDGSDTEIRTFFIRIIIPASQTLSRLAALRQIPVSRAVELGIGPVTPNEVQRARAGVW